jgi:hypothetical protein
MQLTAYSQNRLKATFSKWQVDKDYADPMYNYLVHGFEPGSFFTAVLANDFKDAICRSHPANTITALKALVGWMNDCMPADAYGSYTAVKEWCKLDEEDRRHYLIQHQLVYTPKEETWKILKDDPVQHHAWLEDI